MKLISVEIYGGNFRSLKANFPYTFKVTNQDRKLSTKCFAGLNGSGKSNMLELLSEIFYSLEYYHLENGDPQKKHNKNFGYEIQYLKRFTEGDLIQMLDRPMPGQRMHIRIRKGIESSIEIPKDRKLTQKELVKLEKMREEEDLFEFSIKPEGADDREYETIGGYSFMLLPDKIVAYTSGQNELLSNPFYKLKYNYLYELRKSEEDIMDDRMIYIDAANNQSIFVANILLGDTIRRSRILKETRVKDIKSFRITINLTDPSGNPFQFAQSSNTIIACLKKCATSWDIRPFYGSRKRNQLVLDYFVTKATRLAFEEEFGEQPYHLFRALYQLETLNLKLQKDKIHHLVHRSKKDLSLLDELPVIDPDDLLFRIDNIELIKEEATDEKDELTIRYKHLSDGQHQFNEVMGALMMLNSDQCLLLLDEPDTHFNPELRSKLIKSFNEMAGKEWDKEGDLLDVRNHEIIITTHSPFAISDSKREDVYRFEVNKETGDVNISNPKIPTYGTSVQTILEHVFGNKKTIANLSNLELKRIREKGVEAETVEEISIQRAKLNDFGESIEKFDAIRTLRARENEIENK